MEINLIEQFSERVLSTSEIMVISFEMICYPRKDRLILKHMQIFGTEKSQNLLMGTGKSLF